MSDDTEDRSMTVIFFIRHTLEAPYFLGITVLVSYMTLFSKSIDKKRIKETTEHAIYSYRKLLAEMRHDINASPNPLDAAWSMGFRRVTVASLIFVECDIFLLNTPTIQFKRQSQIKHLGTTFTKNTIASHVHEWRFFA